MLPTREGLSHMFSRSQTVAILVTLLAAVAVSAALGVVRHDVADAAPPGTVPGTALFRFGGQWNVVSGHERYEYLIVGRQTAAAAAAQAGLSLVYHSGIAVNVNWDAGVPYSVASANGWLLRDAAGSFLRHASYTDNYIGDVGSPGYQAEWARRVGDYLASVGADGVFIDDVAANSAMFASGVPAKYPNQASWENAMASFVEHVGGGAAGAWLLCACQCREVGRRG